MMTKAECIAFVESHMVIQYATANGAYTNKVTISPNGAGNHSTGCAQPRSQVFFSNMNKASAGWGVNAILGDFDQGDGIIRVTLRFDKSKRRCSRNWGVGSGKKGSWNDTRIQWEVCEPSGHTYSGGTMIGYDAKKNQGYFERMWRMLVAWNVYCAVAFGYDASMIGDHHESYLAGMGSNHADMSHWLPKHGKSMNALREEVNKILNEEEVPMTKEEVKALISQEVAAKVAKAKEEIRAELRGKVYETIEEAPAWARTELQEAIDMGILKGTGSGLALTEEKLNSTLLSLRAAKAIAKLIVSGMGGVK